MRLTFEELKIFYALWDQEPFPNGMLRVREWLANALGLDRDFWLWDHVVFGGDAIQVSYFMYRVSRDDPAANVLWVPDRGWWEAPSIWLGSRDVQDRLMSFLNAPFGADIRREVAKLRLDAQERAACAGGLLRRAEGRLEYKAHEGQYIHAYHYKREMPARMECEGEGEEELKTLWTDAVFAFPKWTPRAVSMVGGMAHHVWHLTGDPGRHQAEEDEKKNLFSVEFSRNISISEAQSRWWDVLTTLREHDFSTSR